MNMKEIREIAKAQGIKPGKLTKSDLVRTIQQEEGNYACFATLGNGTCEQLRCLWREDCIKMSGQAA